MKRRTRRPAALAPMKKPKGVDRPQDWRTPMSLFRELEKRFGRGGFTLDAAASADNTLCGRYFDEAANALQRPWAGRVFCNPPYRHILPWVVKASDEVADGRAEVVVMLLPARMGALWFDTAERLGRIHRIRGRVAFERGGARSAPFEASVVVVLEPPLVASGDA